MKHRLLHRTLALILSLYLFLSLMPVALAASGTYSGFNWTLENGTLTISGKGALSTWFSINTTQNPNANASVRTIVIQEGITAKLLGTPGDVREKFRGSLTRIVNEGANGLICLIL